MSDTTTDDGYVEAILVWSDQGPAPEVESWLHDHGFQTLEMAAGLLVSGSGRQFRAAFGLDQLVADAGQRLREVEGKAFEKLVGVLYEEPSRKGIGGFPPSERSNGYWDPSDTEIDLAAWNASGPGDPAGLLQTLGSGAGP